MAMRAIDIGTPRVIQAVDTLTVTEAAALMRRQQAGCLVVTRGPEEGGMPIGIVTDRDLALRVIGACRDPDGTRLASVLSAPLVVCRSDASIDEVVGVMRGSGVRRLPLLDEAGALVGLVSADDVLIALSELNSRLTEVLVVEPMFDRAYA